MFEEPEWAEAAPAATGLRPVISSRPRAEAPSQIKGSKRRQLLATLHALEAASLPRQPASLPDSESEEEVEVRRKKKKQAKRASLASASVQVGEKRKNKCQKRPPSSNSEEGEAERKKKFCKQGLLGNDLTEGQKKCQKATPGNTAQPLTNGVQTDPQIKKSSAADEPPKPSPSSSSAKPPQTLTRKQWRNRQKNKRRHKNKFRPAQAPDQVAAEAPAETEVPSAPKPEDQEARAEALRARMAQRLDGARFRYLNEQLYSKPSSAAQRLFQEDPEAFLLYHRGFQSQVKKWPLHPVDRIARDLRHRPASLVVADFGCGDCRLASSIRNTVHCFDLASLDPRVTVCDMAQVPLQDESVDVAVFCLSLMGTNIRDFLEEANRVLKPGGLLKVAEISSRFEDIRGFLGAVSKLGFKVISKDLTNSHFFLFDFHKTGPPRVGPKAQLSGLKLQPCLYKRR